MSYCLAEFSRAVFEDVLAGRLERSEKEVGGEKNAVEEWEATRWYLRWWGSDCG